MSKSKKMCTIIGSLVALLIGTGYFLFEVYDKSEKLQDQYPWPIVMIAIVAALGIACSFAERAIRKTFQSD